MPLNTMPTELDCCNAMQQENNMTETTKPRSNCHLRLYNSDGLVIAFDIRDNANSVAKQLFGIFTDDGSDDVDGDCDDLTDVAEQAGGYYICE